MLLKTPGEEHRQIGRSARQSRRGGRPLERTAPAAMASDFGTILRRLRTAKGMSQEALAEAADISTDAVSTYERGVRKRPHRETVAMLADALRLDSKSRFDFIALARATSGRDGGLPQGNLPLDLTSFVGRQLELDEIEALLTEHRAVSLTGSGGIGKTRLALAVAARLRDRQREGAWIVDFSPISGGPIVPSIASVLNVSSSPTSEDALAKQLASYESLLVFDNCELHLEAVASLVTALLRYAPGLRILVTSRERLRIGGEVVYRVSSLDVPGFGVSATEAKQFASFQLFAQRVTVADHTFKVSEAVSDIISDICRRLDGIPLALEIAAAKVPFFGLETLRNELDTHLLAALSGTDRDVADRQRTLSAILSWSYAQLRPDAQHVFRRLSRFAGGWTLDAALFSCVDMPSLPEPSVMGALADLVEQSLVVVSSTASGPRYRMLQVTREFAQTMASTYGDIAVNAERHAAWMSQLAKRADAQALSFAPLQWHEEFGAEFDNVRVAISWAIDTGRDPVLAAGILSGFFGLWTHGGRLGECYFMAKALLAEINASSHPRTVARLLQMEATATSGYESIAAAERAIELFTSVEDFDGAGNAWNLLADGFIATGQLERAEAALRQPVMLLREHTITRPLAAHAVLGIILFMQGRIDEARDRYAESVRNAALIRDDWFRGHLYANISELAFALGEIADALRYAGEAAVCAKRSDQKRLEWAILCNRACYHIANQDVRSARSDALLSLAHSKIQEPKQAVLAIQHLATIAALDGDPLRAALLLGFANEHLSFRQPTEQFGYDALIRSLHEQLSDAAIAQCASNGRELTLEEASFQAEQRVD
jgi:predicted ATPase/DNA-binding XRE family transcriptional regulator